MVKRPAKSSVSEDDGECELLNENGKRPADGRDAPNKDGAKRLKTRGLYRQPTVNELNRLQETEMLFNSNLFRLQIEEVLREVKLKEKTVKKFQQWFDEFKTHMETIPEDETEYDLSKKALRKKLAVKLPVCTEIKKTKCVIKFHKFKNIEIVGSYSLDCAINSKLRVDLQISVPAETYTKNDSINYRYHKKRAAYLAYLASHISSLDIVGELQYTFLNGCETKPVIDLKPNGKLGNHLSVRINLTCEQEAYKLHRFSPIRNNLRESWLFSEVKEESSDIGPPTPYYNSSVLSDLTATANQEFLSESIGSFDNLKQAIVLMKIWLRQRNLTVSGYIVSLFVAHLVQTKRVNNIMSSYQIVRNVWIALKSSEWDTKGISLYKGTDAPSIEEFHQHFPVVFLDRTGYYNLCWEMTKGTYFALKNECSLAIEILDNTSINSFIPLFMVPVESLLKFDHILKFRNLPELKELVIAKADKDKRLNYGLNQLALVTDDLYSMMTKGLGNRVDLIQPLVEGDLSWSVKSSIEKAKTKLYKENLSFGLIYNPENFTNIVDRGPPANLPEAEKFRAFWGSKSELRRFADGAITEACVWDAGTAAERRALPAAVLDYLLQLKYGVPPSQVFHLCSQLETLQARRQCAGAGAAAAQQEEAAARLLRAFHRLRARLRALTQLPLDISAVHGVSPVFSYCDPLPPLPLQPAQAQAQAPAWRRGPSSLLRARERPGAPPPPALPEYTPVSRVVIELGHSGKWPGELEAFRCLKAAFHAQIAARLAQQHALPAQPHAAHADVLCDGYAFRLAVAHPKELLLLRRREDAGVLRLRDTAASERLRRDTVLLPRLVGALHGLHGKHPAYGPAACLLQRWLSAQLLAPPHFPARAAQLLAAAVFVRGAPLAAPPAAPLAAFLRALSLLAERDWPSEMLVLDFNGDMTREEITELERQYAQAEPRPAMHIVTSVDGDAPGAWTAEEPSAGALARARALAAAALAHVRAALGAMEDTLLKLFVPSLSGYDVVVRLHAALAPHAAERLERAPARRHHRRRVPPEDEAAPPPELLPVLEFDPVASYLDELRSAYDEFALFFHDSYGGDVIAVLWRPDVDELKEFQVSNANALMPVQVDGETKYKINKAAIIEDFRILGEGLVKEITVCS